MRKLLQKQIQRKSMLAVIAAMVGFASFGTFYTMANRDHSSAVQADCGNAVCVAIKTDSASPNEVAIPLGGYVQFNSADGKPHRLAEGHGGSSHSHEESFHSPDIKSDEGWRVQFNKPGHFYFHDHMNPEINVLVVVYEPGKDYKIGS